MIAFSNAKFLLFRLGYNQINGQKAYAQRNLIKKNSSALTINALLTSSTLFVKPKRVFLIISRLGQLYYE